MTGEDVSIGDGADELLGAGAGVDADTNDLPRPSSTEKEGVSSMLV